MKIFHGTDNRGITCFRDLRQRKNLDFGDGVYFTSNFEQALRWSCRKENCGAVYECEVSFSSLNILSYDTKSEELNYLFYLCRIGLQNVACDTIERFDEADVVSGLMLDGKVASFEVIAEQFNSGETSYEELCNTIKTFKKPNDQLCFKTAKALLEVNDGLQKVYFTRKEGKQIYIEAEQTLAPVQPRNIV